MGRINVFDVQRAVKKGFIEAMVDNKGDIYLNDCQSGECVRIGNAKGKYDEEDGSEIV